MQGEESRDTRDADRNFDNAADIQHDSSLAGGLQQSPDGSAHPQRPTASPNSGSAITAKNTAPSTQLIPFRPG